MTSSGSNIAACGVCGDTGMRRCPDCRGIQASCSNCVDGKTPCPCKEARGRPMRPFAALPSVARSERLPERYTKNSRAEEWRRLRMAERQAAREAAEARVFALQHPELTKVVPVATPKPPKAKRERKPPKVHGNAKWQELAEPRAEVHEIAFPPIAVRACRHCDTTHPTSLRTCPYTGNALD